MVFLAQVVLGLDRRRGAAIRNALYPPQLKAPHRCWDGFSLWQWLVLTAALRCRDASLLWIVRPSAADVRVSTRGFQTASGPDREIKKGRILICFVFDIFRDEGKRLQVITGGRWAGHCWHCWEDSGWLQIVFAKQFEESSKANCDSSVRTPAIRGKRF